MSTDNSITIVGNCAREVSLKFLESGMAVADFAVAVNYKRGEKESVSFFNVKAFGSLAENVGESIEKGARIIVSGRLEQRSWENEAGEKRSMVEVIAEEVGHSLRWATTTARKNPPKGNTGARPPANEPDDHPF